MAGLATSVSEFRQLFGDPTYLVDRFRRMVPTEYGRIPPYCGEFTGLIRCILTIRFTEQCARTGPRDPQTIIPSRLVLSMLLRKLPTRQIAASPGHDSKCASILVTPDPLNLEVPFERVLQARS